MVEAVVGDTRPVPLEARAPRTHIKPNSLPARLMVGVGALAAVSVIAAGIGRMPGSSENSASARWHRLGRHDIGCCDPGSKDPCRATHPLRPPRAGPEGTPWSEGHPRSGAGAACRGALGDAAGIVVCHDARARGPDEAVGRMIPRDDTAARGVAAMTPSLLAATGTETSRVERSLQFGAMGGDVRLRVACRPDQAGSADRDLRLTAARIEAWARRLTRFSLDSDLSVLNHHSEEPATTIRPTLCAVLRRSRSVAERTEGIVDVGLLGARLAAEDGGDPPAAPGRWTLCSQGRGGVVHREGPVRFDLDGVGKGWIADRALALLSGYPAALVDADGDIAVRLHSAHPWPLAVADPRHADEDLAYLVLGAGRHMDRLGVATSGTSLHRWQHTGGSRHHLIDPRTGAPAVTDVVQATVVAESALAAESLAKAIVISGSQEGLDLAERAGSLAEVLLLDGGEIIASPRTLEWLA